MNTRSKHGNSTLEELERCNWGEPTYGSHLVTECHRLRRIQLRLLTIENLRILIGQNIGLRFLMPLAIEELRRNPLAEGNFYAGDLLCRVLSVSPEYWDTNPDLHREVAAIAERARRMAASEGKLVMRAFQDAIGVFSTADVGRTRLKR